MENKLSGWFLALIFSFMWICVRHSCSVANAEGEREMGNLEGFLF